MPALRPAPALLDSQQFAAHCVMRDLPRLGYLRRDVILIRRGGIAAWGAIVVARHDGDATLATVQRACRHTIVLEAAIDGERWTAPHADVEGVVIMHQHMHAGAPHA